MKSDISQALTFVKQRLGDKARLGIILGSGLGALVDKLQDVTRVEFSEIPGFPRSSVEGHQGALIAGTLNGTPLVCLAGRVHYYEGYAMDQVVIPIRVMVGLGLKSVIITNAAGAVNQDYSPGDLVAIYDHINFMGDNPLRGSANFVDLTQIYSQRLIDLAQQEADSLGIGLRRGVYCAFSGPCYETPAEIRAVRVLGADLVGMSTVPEAIAAAAMGVEVLGISTATNMAAGITGQKLSHEEVIETSARVSQNFTALVTAIVAKLNRLLES
jgi:purine-nucleoside phosphorylase